MSSQNPSPSLGEVLRETAERVQADETRRKIVDDDRQIALHQQVEHLQEACRELDERDHPETAYRMMQFVIRQLERIIRDPADALMSRSADRQAILSSKTNSTPESLEQALLVELSGTSQEIAIMAYTQPDRLGHWLFKSSKVIRDESPKWELCEVFISEYSVLVGFGYTNRPLCELDGQWVGPVTIHEGLQLEKTGG